MASSVARRRGVSDRAATRLNPSHVVIGALLLLLAVALPPFFGSYHHYLASLALINVIMAVGLNILTGNAGQISLCNSSFMAIGAYATTYLASKLGLSYWLALPLAGLISALC